MITCCCIVQFLRINAAGDCDNNAQQGHCMRYDSLSMNTVYWEILQNDSHGHRPFILGIGPISYITLRN